MKMENADMQLHSYWREKERSLVIVVITATVIFSDFSFSLFYCVYCSAFRCSRMAG